MPQLILGLIVFLGVHSIGIVADEWRSQKIAQMGELKWKVIYSLLSLVGLLLVIWGYAQATAAPNLLWKPPTWTRHLTMLLMIPAFILLVATYLPGSRIKAAAGHPMLLGVKIWALAHLLTNSTLADVILFGSFLVWSVVDFATCRRRDRRKGITRSAGSVQGDVLVSLVGIACWVVFAFYLHGLLIGVTLA